MIKYKEIIKKLTTELDINEVQLADRLAITQQTLSERKKKDATKYDDIIKLCLNESIDLNSLFQEDHKQIQQGFSISHPTDENGFIVLNEAYNSWKIPNSILHLFKIDKNVIYKLYKLENNTMSPLIKKYDSVIFCSLEKIDYVINKIDRLKDGDIILYRLAGFACTQNIYCRKVYMISRSRYILKAIDSEIPEYEVNYSPKGNGTRDWEKNDIEIFGIVEKIIKNNV